MDVAERITQQLTPHLSTLENKELEMRIGKNIRSQFQPGVNEHIFSVILKKFKACQDWTHMYETSCKDWLWKNGQRRRVSDHSDVVVRKTTNHKIAADMPSDCAFDIRVALSTETPLESLPPEHASCYRTKHTYSFCEDLWRFDLSMTQFSNNAHRDPDDEEKTTYEIELELLDIGRLSHVESRKKIIERGLILCRSLTTILNHV